MRRKLEMYSQIPMEFFQDHFNGKWKYTSWHGNPVFQLPYQFEQINLMKDFLASHFPSWNVTESSIPGQTSYFMFDINMPLPDMNNHVYFEIIFASDVKGSTCVVQEIGEEEITYTKKIYEVVCQEGYEETHANT